MSKIAVKVMKLSHFDEGYSLPTYASLGAAGADVRAMLGPNEKIIIKPGTRTLIPTGLVFEIPLGYEMQVRPRSGLSLKTSLMILNSPGTIDSDYRGEVKIIMVNLGTEDQVIGHGDRVAQLVLSAVDLFEFVEVTEIQQTKRGAGGFGSTGI